MIKRINIFIISTIFSILLNINAFGQPRIKFDSLDYTIPPVKRNRHAELKIPFNNIGDLPLIITSAQGTGTPSVTRPQQPVLPNETGFIVFSMPANFVGSSTQIISIHTNIDEKSIVLKIRLQVIEDRLLDDKVFGKVTDEHGFSLPGASVGVEDTRNGITTDKDGNYSIRVKQNQVIVFSFAGMIAQRVNATKNEINVKMQQDDSWLRNDMPPYPWPIQRKQRTITAKDLKKSDDPAYNFRENARNNLFFIFVSDTASLSNLDLEFQKKYKILYSLPGNYSIKYLKAYNKLTFKFLTKSFKKIWRTEIRKDAFGLDGFVK